LASRRSAKRLAVNMSNLSFSLGLKSISFSLC